MAVCAMTIRNEQIYVPAPVDVEALGRMIERSVAAIERSKAILSRLAAAKDPDEVLEPRASSRLP
jgi:hypothetical protein